MHALPELWLPILVAGIAVFVASMLIHMVFQWHRADYLPLPNEDAVRDAIRPAALPPGHYVFPYCSNHKDMQNEAMQKKYIEGPIGLLTVLPNGKPTMGGKMLGWFVLTLVVATIAALLALQALGLDGSRHHFAHHLAMITFLTYAGGSVTNGIWMGRRWPAVGRDALDSLIYAVVSGAAFLWLLPHG